MLSRTYSELLCSKNKGFVARASRFAADLESIHAAFLTPIPESDQRDHHQEDLRSADRGGDAEGLAQYVQQSSKEDAHLLAKDWLHRKSPAGAAHVRPAPGRLASTDMPPFMAFCSPPSSSPTPPFAAPLPSTDISVVDEDDKHRESGPKVLSVMLQGDCPPSPSAEGFAAVAGGLAVARLSSGLQLIEKPAVAVGVVSGRAGVAGLSGLVVGLLGGVGLSRLWCRLRRRRQRRRTRGHMALAHVSVAGSD